MDDDALNASRLNANPGGKQPKMRDTEIPVTECGPKVRNLKVVPSSSPPRYVQSMVFKAGDVLLTEKAERVLKAGDSLIDQAKGAVQVAKECDLYKKGMSMKGPILKTAQTTEDDDGFDDEDPDADDDDEEKGVVRDLTLSTIHVLSQRSDFKNEKCKLEKTVEQMGGRCVWLPKFHACCNAIEYVWGNRKKANRKTCDFKMETLRRTGFKTILQVDPTFVQKAFRKGRNFMSALRGGADVLTMFKQVAKIKKERYVSHRRPAPAQYE